MTTHKLALAGALTGAVTLAAIAPTFPHAVVGDRIFPVTLAIDDPGVADEVSLPTFTRFRNADGSIETDISAEFSKRITETFAISVGETWTRQVPGGRGFQNLELGLKYQLLTNAEHEFMLSAGVAFEFGGTGSKKVAEPFTTVTPRLFFGKGFGDLPQGMAWARPIAVTGQIGLSIPDSRAVKTFTLDPDSGDVGVDIDRRPTYLNWGASLQYSLPYFNAHVGQIDNEVLRRLIPVVEGSFQTPVGNRIARQPTTGTINPGIIYSGDTFQIAVEAMIPINRASGKHLGVIAQVHVFLDDIFPSTIGRPLFSRN